MKTNPLAGTYEVKMEVEKETKELQEIIALLETIKLTKGRYETALADAEAQIRAIMRELAVAPVEDHSGLMQEIPTEIPTPEVEARIANQLHMQGKFQTRVRTFDQGKFVEYSLTTLAPLGGIALQELVTLLDELRKRNHQQGYLRLRSEVEKEIGGRQPPDTPPPPGPAPSQKTPPQQPPTPLPMKPHNKIV